ncbi:MAG: glycosyltransferase family 2 protein [Planctomycetes bacterium]|nr:glycosyltransferase family 2 protein [Planctomycetota bacterium]
MGPLIQDALATINNLILAYFVALNGVYLLTSLFAFGALRKFAYRSSAMEVQDMLRIGGAPPITLLVPAYNEQETCVESVRSLLTLTYPDYEILVVNDGSRDRTLDRLVETFELEPAPRVPTASLATAPVRGLYRSRRNALLWVIDKENGGKADALNAGINYCRTALFCAVDADSLLERGALSRVVRPFLEDSRTVAAGGIIRIINGCTVEAGLVTDVRLPRNGLALLQALEYLRAFLSARMGWSAINATLVISGAFGLFRRSTVVEAGGYSTRTVGEDMELVVRLHRHCMDRRMPYRISFVPDPIAWTECPERFRDLGRQRNRWQRGLLESLLGHLGMLGRPRYGRIGLLAFPYFLFLEGFGPLIESVGYASFAASVALGLASLEYVFAFLMVAVVLGTALSVASVAMEELTIRRYKRFSDLWILFGLAFVENFGYRQISSLWRWLGVLSYVAGAKGWGKMSRKGFQRKASP